MTHIKEDIPDVSFSEPLVTITEIPEETDNGR